MQPLLTRPASTPSSPLEQDDVPQAFVSYPILTLPDQQHRTHGSLLTSLYCSISSVIPMYNSLIEELGVTEL